MPVRDINYGFPSVVVQSFLANRENRNRPAPTVELAKRTPTAPRKTTKRA